MMALTFASHGWIRLYADMTKSEGVTLEKPEGKSFQSLKSGIDLSGFTVVDCPTRGKKETLDKKIIVDCMKCVARLKSSFDLSAGLLILADPWVQIWPAAPEYSNYGCVDLWRR